MKRIGLLTAGGDTPALNATLYGAVVRANECKVEAYGFIKGFSSLLNARVPHVRLNPLFTTIPELDPSLGGIVIGASRDYIDSQDTATTEEVVERMKRLGIEGLICVGGDGTLSGMQVLSIYFPSVLAPKTIDNDLGLNYRHEPDEWQREQIEGHPGFRYVRTPSHTRFELDQLINYVTPGYATSIFVSASGVQRIRTTAESHRRIAIVEVMCRHSGYLALGSAYGQPDIVLIPESPLNIDRLVKRVIEIYELQKNVVIVCAEGIRDEEGRELGAEQNSTDPAGNKILSGAGEALRQLLIERLGDSYFTSKRRNESARAAIFTRKVGHTQRGGRPVLFDSFYATQLGGHAVDLLLQGHDYGTEAIGVGLVESLPGLYWLNYLGAPYVDLIGRDRLLTARAYEVKTVGDGVLLALDSSPDAWDSAAYRDREEETIAHLGKQYFFSRFEPDRKTIAPEFIADDVR